MKPGYTFNKVLTFITREGIEKKEPGICFFTTLDVPEKRKLTLSKTYNPEEYPHYDNYDAINVDRVKDIPYDYDGVMGVPVTILGYDLDDVKIDSLMKNNKLYFKKNCLITCTQFEIVDARSIALNDRQKNKNTYLIKDADSAINGKPTYARICIKRVS